MHVSFRKTQRETTATRNRKNKWGATSLASLYGKCLHDLRSDVDIYDIYISVFCKSSEHFVDFKAFSHIYSRFFFTGPDLGKLGRESASFFLEGLEVSD